MKTVLLMQLERETKGALRYKEVQTDGKLTGDMYAVGTLYVRKNFFTNIPKDLKVTIETESPL